MGAVFNPGKKVNAGNFLAGYPGIGVVDSRLPYMRNITGDDIPDGSITVLKLATNSVSTAKIIDSNVTTAKIADSNVTTAKIADLNVTPEKISNTIRIISAPATIAANDVVILDTAGGNAITFPTVVSIAGKRYTIANNGGTADTLTPQVGQTVGGLATFSLASAAFATFVSDGVSNWVQIG